MINSNQMMI